MDEPTKAKIRKRATRRFWVHVPVLVVLSGLSLLSRLVPGSLKENFSTHALLDRAALLNQEFSRFFMNRPNVLVTFPPPACADERAAWADSIQTALGQEAAVFIRDGKQLTWVCEPDTLQAGMSLVKQSFAAEKVQGNRDHPDRLGRMEASHWSVRPDTLQPGYRVLMVGRADDNLRWGVAFRTRDSWPAFFKMLEVPRGTWLSLDHPATQLGDFIALPRSDLKKFITGIRVYSDDRIIFTSPNLDTTSFRHIEDLHDGRKVEYYQSSLDRIYVQEMNRGKLPWVAVFLPLVFIVPSVRWYRQVRRLTEPMA
ncbi:MAG: hypothetical protein NT025_04525 [bacterium]|nr:hypothetical protein [bacterium]